MKKITFLITLIFLTTASAWASYTKENIQNPKTEFLQTHLDACTVTVEAGVRGTDCWGNLVRIVNVSTVTAANCLAAYQQASATAYSGALQALASIQDECFGPSNPKIIRFSTLHFKTFLFENSGLN